MLTVSNSERRHFSPWYVQFGAPTFPDIRCRTTKCNEINCLRGGVHNPVEFLPVPPPKAVAKLVGGPTAPPPKVAANLAGGPTVPPKAKAGVNHSPGVTLLEGPEASPVPTELLAVTVNV